MSWLEPQADGSIRSGSSTCRVARGHTVGVDHARNNETGVVQDIAAIAAICREAQVFLHVDAAQSVGKLPIDVHALDVDLLSISAHKMYGPKGSGHCMYRRARGLG